MESSKTIVTGKSLLISTALVLLVGLSIFGIVGFNDKDTAKDMEKIQDVIMKAVEVSHSLPVMPQPLVSVPSEKIPEDVKRMMYDKVTSSFTEYYSAKSPLLAQRIQILQDSIDVQEKQKFRAIDGGIVKSENISIIVDGDTATAEADIWTFSKMQEENKKILNPQNGKHYVFTLARENNKWKITGEEFKHLPGEQP